MEVVVSRMRYIASQLQDQEGQIPVRIFAVGASVSNAQDLGEWIGANSKTHTLFHFHPSVRPTPMEIHIQGFVQQSFSARALSMSKPTYLAIKNARADERKMRNEHETVTVADRQVIVFVPSRRQARFAALELVTFVSGEEDNEILKGAQYRRTENSTIEGLLNELGDRSLANAAPYGIGILHNALSEREQAIVRHLYNIKYLQVLIVVYDYSWRLHEECHTVIVQGTQFYNGKEYRYQDYSIMDLLDLMRHAQRESPASNCKCYLLCNQPRKEYYKKFLFEPFPIESHFDHFLLDTVNAEIANKTITGTQDAVDYLTWSFLYRRLRQNPNYYNLHGTSHQHLSDYLSELVDSTLTDLQQSQCILMEPNDDNTDTNLSAMNLGTIASHFYVQCSTIEIFSTSITEKTKLRGLMEILCAATEFDSQVIRQKEEGVLRKMAAHAPLKLERTKFNDPHTKVNLLIQSHFSRNRLSPDLEKDKEEVLLESVRLLPAMVDVVATERWLNPALAAMELSQMIVQAMWDKDSVLLQLPHFTRDLCERCEKQGGVETIFDLINMDDDKRSELLKDLSDDEMTDVAKALNRYPNIEVSFEIEDSDQITAGSGVVVWVILDIEQDEDEENNGLVGIYAPHFPQKNPKIEEWWILIGDVENNQIKTTKRMAVTKPGKVKLQFIAPSTPGEHEFKLYFMCDSYVGCDQDLDIKINVLPGDGSDEESDAEMQ
jgi:pre-mRNA-splicing helicase BRR2